MIGKPEAAGMICNKQQREMGMVNLTNEFLRANVGRNTKMRTGAKAPVLLTWAY
ncbi:hypothetical protein SAMN05216403_1334 [Nitrosospira multiformis ATCC 25196]|uniref:Uncharacterized protein n=1 Tax=Nitrosospira multiformis (strain ATCC 25196 / NCIMB 11849 / C 71) TaxID=323848 RepID=A0A1H5XL91_NITMU|nr:hypothetical protein SAMN05216403_1334 [Nitrosospira multiformis ATCC 25196]